MSKSFRPGTSRVAAIYNPYIHGWINYYGQFYRKQLRPTLLRIDTYLVRWARWKFKRLRRRRRGAWQWLARVRRDNPTLFALALPVCRQPNIGSRVNREVHARF